MRFYNINTYGKMLLQRLGALPAYESSDESRILYDSVTESVYYADSTTFQHLANLTDISFSRLNANGAVGTGATQVAQGNHTHPGSSLIATPGFLIRRPFIVLGTTSIRITQGSMYHVDGSTERLIHAAIDVSFVFGPGGSNAASSALGASEWHYLYIDDSSLSGDTFVASNLLNSTTAPTWDVSKGAWYNGNDRCIGMFYTTAASLIMDFFHGGDDVIYWGDQITAYAAYPGTGWATVDLTIPATGLLSNKVPVTFQSSANGYVGAGVQLYWRKGGSTTPNGHLMALLRNISSGDNISYFTANTLNVVAQDASPSIEVRSSASDGDIRLYVYQDGYCLPNGM